MARAGEMGEAAVELGILGAAVACVPFDAIGCQKQVCACMSADTILG